jgi:hypothetical protein
MLVALRVVHGQSQTHEFVFFITYIGQVKLLTVISWLAHC